MNKFFSIIARAAGAVEVFIYDQIGGDWFTSDGVAANQFIPALNQHQGRDLLVRINSPGGNVFDGLAIHNTLKTWPHHVETRVEGLAASIASIIALAGKEVSMAESAALMIHDPVSVAVGNSAKMRTAAEMLDQVAGQLADIYAARSGKSKESILSDMGRERWFTALEAKDFGLVDSITAPLRMAAHFDLGAFQNVPRALMPTPAPARQNGASRPEVVSRLFGRQLERHHIDAMVRVFDSDRQAFDAIAEAIPLAPPPGGDPVGAHVGAPNTGSRVEDAYSMYLAKLKRVRREQ